MNTALGSLLATRLDAVLGTTLAQHPVLLEGSRGHSATQPAAFLHGQETIIRRGTGEQGEAAARAGQAGARQVGQGSSAGADALAGQGQASARTVLSEPARTILALLLSHTDGKTAVQGRQPLLVLPHNSPPGAPATAGSTATGGPGSTAAIPGQIAPAGSAATGRPAPHAPQAPSPLGTAKPGAPATEGITSRGRATTERVSLPPAPTNMAATLAGALQRALAQSGMFYESHLAQMAFGQRNPAEVAREPQARLDTAAPPSNRSAMAEGSSTSSTSPSSSGASAQAQPSGPASSPATGTLSGLAPEAAPLVRQQLEVLANQAFAWQGEAWNGAPLQWEVQHRAPDDASPEPLATWATRLVLHMPRLGAIEARLTLAGDRLVLRLEAPDSAPLLQQHLDVLREHLDHQGLQLTDTTINQQSGPGAGA